MSKVGLHDHYDVVIIGAGPVGTGLAIDLARRGRSVCLVEKYVALQRIPKGQNLTQRSGEHLKRWGVSAAIRNATLIPPEFGNQGITAYGSWLSGWHYDWFKRASVRDYYFADNERLPQYETERVLRERASSLPGIDLITGWSYHSHLEHNDSLTVTIASSKDSAPLQRDSQKNGHSQTEPHDSTQLQITASWLVGCDGARSAVRESAGIEQTVDAHDRRMALVTFRSAELNDLLTERFPGCTIFNAIHPDLKGYWQFLGRTDAHDSFFFHAPVAKDSKVETFDFPALLHRAAGVSVKADLDYVGFWDLRFTQATNYRNGRVFVAGDAAHSHPPYGGYGVNLGFEDARNLAWKLDAHLAGWGNEQLLDSYSAERHPVFASTRDNFIARMIKSDAEFTAQFNPELDLPAFESHWNKRAQGGQKEVQYYVPNYAGSPVVVREKSASSGAVGDHRHVARAGYHLSPRRIDACDRIESALVESAQVESDYLFNLLGDGFSLITLNPQSDLSNAFTNAARQLAIPFHVITAQRNEENAQWQADALLVRPDEYLVWAGNIADADPDYLLRRAIGLVT